MYFGMKSNDITKDRLEYYASRRSMATKLIVTDGMEDGASCPTFPRSGGVGSPPGTAATFSGTETNANVVGTKQQFSIKIGADNTVNGTGLIGNGNTYTVDIIEKRHADEQDDPCTWWTLDPASLASEPSHSVSAAPGATADPPFVEDRPPGTISEEERRDHDPPPNGHGKTWEVTTCSLGRRNSVTPRTLKTEVYRCQS